jgi:uncharacterized membrane protein
MRVINPFQMNNWDISYLFIFILIIQTFLWITVFFELNGNHLPIISVILTSISLFYINGVLILRILRIHNLGNIENFLYAVGLSIAVTMFLGMAIDLIYPVFGIKTPISTLPLIITFTVFTTFLCILSHSRDRTFENQTYLDLTGIINPMLFLFLIPFLAIFGTYMMNYYGSNSILMIMYLLIALIPIMVAFDKFIPKRLYPLTVFLLSISLLFSSSLISNYINGWDINMEYYFSNGVVTNSYWNTEIPEILNSMLSIVIVEPIFSKISGLSVVDIFKLIYPILFSFVVVGLYSVFRKQTTRKISFMACFLFISVFMFFLEMPYLARQEIGELFVVLMIMVMVEKNLSKRNLTILTVFFIPALLVSHYSLDYIYMFLLLCSYLVILIRNSNLISKLPILGRWGIIKFFFYKDDVYGDTKILDYKLQLLLIFSLTLIYYNLFSSAALFDLTVFTLNNVMSTAYQYLFNPNSLAAVGIVTSEKSFLRSIALDLHLIIEFMIGIGILLLLYRRTQMKFNENFSLFSVMSFLMLGLVLVVPFLAGALNPERFYQIALIFLSIFFVVGWIGVFRIINRIFNFKWKKKSIYSNSLKLIAIFLAISLIFNSGVVYEVFHDKPTSLSLHSTMDGPKFNNMELTGAEWLNNHKLDIIVYSDVYRSLLLNGYFINTHTSLENGTDVVQPSYIFLGTYNVINHQIAAPAKGSSPVAYLDDRNYTTFYNKSYDNGGSQIYLT